MGKFSNIVLAVTVTDDKIAAIDVVSQNETPNYWKKAVVLIDRIIEANSTDVDGITGATKSSNAIKAAVNNALDSAKIKVSVQDSTSRNFFTTSSFKRSISASISFRSFNGRKIGRHFRVCRNFLYMDQYLII